MSEQVLSFGMMAPLVTPVTDEVEREILMDALMDTSILRLNYEGTLVYSNSNRYADEGAGIIFASVDAADEFENAVRDAGLEIAQKGVFYSCSWYNGSDSDMACCTLEQFHIGVRQGRS